MPTDEPSTRDDERPSVQRVALNDERIAGLRALADSLGFRLFDADLMGCHD